MNNRQKAKHFKKLYEQTLPWQPALKFKESELKKYRCRVEIDKERKGAAINEMSKHFEKLASERMEYNAALKCYELTLWFKD